MKIFTIKKGKKGWVWNISDQNGKIIASSTSEAYTRASTCKRGIHRFIKDIKLTQYKIVRG